MPITMEPMTQWAQPGLAVWVGRADECATVAQLLARARAGEGGALVIRGEPGVGKTALVNFALARCEDITVLRVTGVEAESDLAFAGLHGLVRPVLDFIEELPESHARALEGALGLAASTEPDRFLVSAAVLGLISAASERQPLVCVIDDAQWLDKPSADALIFTARRLQVERAAMLFAAREGEPWRFDLNGLDVLALNGLPDEAAGQLLRACAPSAVTSVRMRLLSEANGNPLALQELAAALSEEQLAGRAALPEAMALTPRLAAVFRNHVRALRADTQLALLVAALDGTGSLDAVLGVLGGARDTSRRTR